MKSQKALESALKALEADKKAVDQQKETLENQIADVKAMLGRGPRSSAGKTAKKVLKKKSRLTAAGRKALSDAMKKRWAESKKRGKSRP